MDPRPSIAPAGRACKAELRYHARMRGGLLVAGIVILAGCSRRHRERAPGPPGSDAGAGLAVITERRAASQPCAPPDPAPLTGEGCNTSADCKGPGPTPRCVRALGRRQRNVCVSDDCQADAECNGGVCQCSAGHAPGNHCVGGNCRVDADCPGSACSPSLSQSPQGACGDPAADVVGYFCHTSTDTCH